MARKPIEMVRIPLEEKEDDEDGDERDVNAVFPTECLSANAEERQKVEEAVKNRFISESELQETKESGDSIGYGRKEDIGKSLAVILAENKQKKEDEFDDYWKSMKQGKNRPLDPDDFEFVDSVFREESKKTKEQFAQQRKDIEEFKKAREESMTSEKPVVSEQKNLRKPTKKPSRTSLKPRIKVIPRRRSEESEQREAKKTKQDANTAL